MQNRDTSVTVLIPTYKRVDMLEKCLMGIYAMRTRPNQVIVIYRPDDDEKTKKWLTTKGIETYEDLDIVEVYQPGVVAALNAGIAEVRHEVVAIFDDDAVPRSDWLDIVIPHYSNPLVAGVGGRDLVQPHTPQKEIYEGVGIRNFWGRVNGGHHLVVGPSRFVCALKGCNFSFRMAALGTLKFDDRLFGKGAQVGNESWFCLNLVAAGWKLILEPSAVVDHYPASKEDYQRLEFSEHRCFESAANNTAIETAYLNSAERARYLFYFLMIGSRYCPGLYYMLHSLLKRPKALWGQLKGGWSGFITGYRLAKHLKTSPPGVPTAPPSKK